MDSECCLECPEKASCREHPGQLDTGSELEVELCVPCG